jgi:hypothetical protein
MLALFDVFRQTLIYSAFAAVHGSTAIFDHPSGRK